MNSRDISNSPASKQTLIGLCGCARCGKDTAAKRLIEKGWRRVAFADALKADVIYALTRATKKAYVPRADHPSWTMFEDPASKEKLRPLMVEYGRAMRAIKDDYWIQRLLRDYLRGAGRFVVTDVRYANEANWIRERGGKVIRIVRPGFEPVNAEETASLKLVSADFEVLNDSTPETLGQIVLGLAESTKI